MKKGFKDFVMAANAVVKTYDVTEAIGFVGNESITFVDVRDEKEVDKTGRIPGAMHASRGMLEFHIDPASLAEGVSRP